MAAPARATGILVPTDRTLGALSIVSQRVLVTIDDQAATTRVEQEFKNSTSRPLEGHYLFPLPAGAGVKDFAMWMDGKRVKAELVEATQARKIYEDIVRRTKDPGLLEQMGNNLWRVRVFPIPAHGTQKIEISYHEIVPRDSGICEYTYPLRGGGEHARVEGSFTVRVDLSSAAALKSVYSPTHAVGVNRDGDHKAVVGFEASRYLLDRDFQLFWSADQQDVGLSLLTYRDSPGDQGYFLALVSPKVSLAPGDRIPRDVVFVLDVSGSMAGQKIVQAKKALEFCLKQLGPQDRFGLLKFSTLVERFRPALQPVTPSTLEQAANWVRQIEALGGTNIRDALVDALALRTGDARPFTVVFLTDGEPTIGVTDPAEILKEVSAKNSASTRIFSLGVGDEVNAALLDQLADRSNATSVYVRPNEDIEHKVSSFYGKISHPVLDQLSLALVGAGISVSDQFPPRLPDLFHGGQIVVAGRFNGSGRATLQLTGQVSGRSKTFVQEVTLPQERRGVDFLPALWAKRKIGYLLDQIRLKGENKELVDEVIALAKRHGIATPYTSFLATPDSHPVAMAPATPAFGDRSHQSAQKSEVGIGGFRGKVRERESGLMGRSSGADAPAMALDEALDRLVETPGQDAARFEKQSNGMGGGNEVARAIELRDLKDADATRDVGIRAVNGRSFAMIAGIWVDEKVTKEMKRRTIEYLGPAYFRLLELYPDLKSTLALGARVVFVTPSGTALVIDSKGEQNLSDDELRSLMKAPTK